MKIELDNTNFEEVYLKIINEQLKPYHCYTSVCEATLVFKNEKSTLELIGLPTMCSSLIKKLNLAVIFFDKYRYENKTDRIEYCIENEEVA